MEDEPDARHVRQPAEEGRADAAQAKHQAEEDAGYHTYLVRHEVGGIDHDGGKGRGNHQTGDDSHHQRARQTQVGHGQGEGGCAQDGEEDDVLAPVAVAQEATHQRADGKGGQVGEEAILGLLHAEAELLDEVEGEVTGHAGVEEVFGEYHQHQYAQGDTHHASGQRRGSHPARTARHPRPAQHQTVPIAYARQEERSQQGGQGKPGHGVLAERNDDQCRQQGADGTAAVAAHLENGLCQALAAARSQLRHPRRFGMEDGRAATYQRHGEQD